MATVDIALDKMVCYCFGLRESDVRSTMYSSGCAHLKEIMDCSGAGTGCTACHRRIQAVLNSHADGDQCPGSSPTCVTK
jgi:bacterioferritin-associated ferredoxin